MLRGRFWVEVALGSFTAILTAVTLISREWIELVLRVDPDHDTGLLEWLIVVTLATATLLFSLLAHAEWKHTLVDATE
jgi:hypothetical protein